MDNFGLFTQMDLCSQEQRSQWQAFCLPATLMGDKSAEAHVHATQHRPPSTFNEGKRELGQPSRAETRTYTVHTCRASARAGRR
jgi:hypothetical protein